MTFIRPARQAQEKQDERLSILQPVGYSSSSCGYCSNERGTRTDKHSSKSYGCWAHTLSCQAYVDLLKQGWRRSGKYLYKPDMAATCCPQFTISLDAAVFQPSKSQKQILRRFSNFVIKGGHEGQVGWGRVAPSAAGEEGGGDNVIEAGTGEGDAPSVHEASGLSKAQVEGSELSMNEGGSDAGGSKQGASGVKVGGQKKEKKMRVSTAGFRNDRGTRNEGENGGTVAGNQTSRERIKEVGTSEAPKQNKKKGKYSANQSIGADGKKASWLGMMHEGDWDTKKESNHRFEYVLEPASFTEEKYQLYHLYQTTIHNDKPTKLTREGFTRFLVDTPLELEETENPSHHYGSFHAKYLLDDELIAFAVLDILPGSVSSVYFVWSPAYSALGLGKLSALKEIAMVVEMKESGMSDMERYMMGFYIHSCPKMRYKAEYQPSELLDPDTNVFYPWEHCKPILDKDPRQSLSGTVRPPREERTRERLSRSGAREGDEESGMETSEDDDEEDDDDDATFPAVPPPGFLDYHRLPADVLRNSYTFEGRKVLPLVLSKAWKDESKKVASQQLLAATGDKFLGRIAIWTG